MQNRLLLGLLMSLAMASAYAQDVPTLTSADVMPEPALPLESPEPAPAVAAASVADQPSVKIPVLADPIDTLSVLDKGMASYYHSRFDGRRTASGKRYQHHELTAAHRSLPFGTKVLVTNTQNGKQVMVTINDRGPFAKKRVIDLSGAAADALGMKTTGVAHVEVAMVEPCKNCK